MIDASALLALLFREPGQEMVQASLGMGAVSAVNLAEVATKLVRKGVPPQSAVDILRNLSLNVLDWTQELALESTWLADLAWSDGLALGDRACLTLARRLQVPAITADRTWANLPSGVQVKLIR